MSLNACLQLPTLASPWSGVRSAKKVGEICLQVHLIRWRRVLGSEDCLFVNIYIPSVNTIFFEYLLRITYNCLRYTMPSKVLSESECTSSHQDSGTILISFPLRFRKNSCPVFYSMGGMKKKEEMRV